MENLYKLIDAWIQSYACIDDSLTSAFTQINRSMEAVSKIQAKNALAPKDVTWSISNYTMTFDQARAYCYSRGDWLANPENFNELATGVKSQLVPGQLLWYQHTGGPACRTYSKGSGGGSTTATGNCNDSNYAFCYSGQVKKKVCSDGTVTWLWKDCPVV